MHYNVISNKWDKKSKIEFKLIEPIDHIRSHSEFAITAALIQLTRQYKPKATTANKENHSIQVWCLCCVIGFCFFSLFSCFVSFLASSCEWVCIQNEMPISLYGSVKRDLVNMFLLYVLFLFAWNSSGSFFYCRMFVVVVVAVVFSLDLFEFYRRLCFVPFVWFHSFYGDLDSLVRRLFFLTIRLFFLLKIDCESVLRLFLSEG